MNHERREDYQNFESFKVLLVANVEAIKEIKELTIRFHDENKLWRKEHSGEGHDTTHSRINERMEKIEKDQVRIKTWGGVAVFVWSWIVKFIKWPWGNGP